MRKLPDANEPADTRDASELPEVRKLPDANEPADTRDAVAETQQAAMAVAAGGWHTCAATTDHRVLCWGANADGQVGHARGGDFLTPDEVDWPDFRATGVAGGTFSTCAIQASSGVLGCWGWWSWYYTCIDPQWNLPTGPFFGLVEPGGLDEPVVAVGNGDGMACVLTVTGRVVCWTPNPEWPGRMNGGQPPTCGPFQVAGLPANITAISVGGYHACALGAKGEVTCWGSNEYGQLGGLPPSGSMVAPPVPLPPAVAIATGWDHTCALTVAGEVKCWGWNGFGQLGNNAMDESPTPVDVAELDPDVVRLAGGPENHATCAVTAQGAVKCWGLVSDYFLSGWSSKDGPVSIPGLDMPIETLAIGYAHICALTRTNRILCWGKNDAGQLGTGSYTNSDRPQFVVGF